VVISSTNKVTGTVIRDGSEHWSQRSHHRRLRHWGQRYRDRYDGRQWQFLSLALGFPEQVRHPQNVHPVELLQAIHLQWVLVFGANQRV